ncbi:hypothetical protein KH017_20735, partial [bacterium]|nr:hypothetical protein [bacterium]
MKKIDLRRFDANMKTAEVCAGGGVFWIDADDSRCRLDGFAFRSAGEPFRRLPYSPALPEAVNALAGHTAGGMLTIDAAGISPVPEHARVIERTARLDREAIIFPLFRLAYGEDPILLETLPYVLSAENAEDIPMEFADLSVDWRSGGQDITQPGIYQVAVTPRPPFEGVPLACPEAEITLTVVEEGLPYLRRAYHDVHTERDILELYGPMPGGFTGQVYCSEDSGESWTAWGEWTPVEN